MTGVPFLGTYLMCWEVLQKRSDSLLTDFLVATAHIHIKVHVVEVLWKLILQCHYF